MQPHIDSYSYMRDTIYPKFISNNDDTDKENYPCTKASPSPNMTPSPTPEASQVQKIFYILTVLRCTLELESRVKYHCLVFCLMIETSKLDILLSVGCAVGLNVWDFGYVIYNEIIVCHHRN